MRRFLIAEFEDADRLLAAARDLRARGVGPLDALSPYPIAGLDEALTLPASPVRWPMLIAALAVAAAAYGLEAWSAVVAYPFNSGGRPLNSWPVFLLAPIEVGILAAALAGFVALLVVCGLPRLVHPVFDYEGVERASDDRFFLLLPAPPDEAAERDMRRWLAEAHALRIDGASS